MREEEEEEEERIVLPFILRLSSTGAIQLTLVYGGYKRSLLPSLLSFSSLPSPVKFV
jgi:hypothetical protein